MKLIFLGVSSAFSVGDMTFQSNMLLESDSGRKMLIDCGSDIRHSLHALGYSYQDIEAVYISHLHADHIGGLEWLGFSKLFFENKRAKLYISEDQRETLWNNALSAGMSSLADKQATLSTYFEVQPLSAQLSFVWENYQFQLVRTYHTINNHCVLPSYGLFISGESNVLITTDTRYELKLFETFYNAADLIFHDCETSRRISEQHAHYSDLKTLKPAIKEKIWLYDFNEGPPPDAKRDGFKGFVSRGQLFKI